MWVASPSLGTVPPHTSLAAPAPIRLGLERPLPAGPRFVQEGFADLGTPLAEVTFVVVDLETTGGAPGAQAITEIGAVKVRGGEVVAEFQTLVNPHVAIPAYITVLTGITTAMTALAPPIEEVLPAFLAWASFETGSVMVAHNARFDAGFLRAAARDLDYTWPRPQVVDTLALARRALTRDDVPNFKLGTLARVLGASVQPEHRALADAQATTDVLHTLLERLAPLGVTHLEDLATASDPVPSARRRKVTLADGLPRQPGVYQFLGPSGEILYVGTATDLRARVRSYFTAAEKRRRIGEMVDLARDVRAIPCGSVIEARVRELRLIDAHQPPYNRRSRAAGSKPYVRLTEEAHPRISVVRSVSRQALSQSWGPFPSRSAATAAAEALAAATGLRTCTQRLPLTPREGARGCALRELGGCSAPCHPHGDPAAHSDAVDLARRVLAGDMGPLERDLRARIAGLAEQQRYEEAASLRDRLRSALAGARRAETLRAFAFTPEMTLARPVENRWEVLLIRWGRLAGSTSFAGGQDPNPVLAELRGGAEHVPEPAGVGEAALVEETMLLADWFDSQGSRIVDLAESHPPLAYPVRGAHSVPLPPRGGPADPRAGA